MNRKTRARYRWRLAPLALAVALTLAVAAPAAAKGPVFYPYTCSPAPCEHRAAVGDRQGVDGRDAGIVAGSVAVLVLIMAGGMLLATHRRDVHCDVQPRLERG